MAQLALHKPEPASTPLSSFESARGVQAGVSMQGVTSFEELLRSSMKKVNELQLASDDKLRKLATGDVDDISEVVLSASRAEIALKLLMEIRNKFVDAYQTLSRISA
ncbi:MAG: flagellar hook-basal body complex protein FliE [Fretibacterium sp.]|nr:flagellar hook-basal body complex protein FliE [Fretibacterium sp.]